MYQDIHHVLVDISKKHQAKPERFFKTITGTYGAHDKFLGVNTPFLRQLAKTHEDLDFENLTSLIHSNYNEERLLALFILLEQRKHGRKKEIVKFYLTHIEFVNNWNLVDASAHWIIGEFAFEKNNYSLLYDYAKQENIWLRRIAIVATLFPIKHDIYTPTLEISQMLLDDKEDLIHKACGWMLRELGKRNQSILEHFLQVHGKEMPRTTLRYAIERLDKTTRQFWLDSTKS